MFFTMTAAIGAAMTAAVWSIDGGLVVAGLVAGAAGLASAAAASLLMIRVDRRARAIDPEVGMESLPADLPRLSRLRMSGHRFCDVNLRQNENLSRLAVKCQRKPA